MPHGESPDFEAIVSHEDTEEYGRHIEMASKATVAVALSEMMEDYVSFGPSRQLVVDRCREIVSSKDPFPNIKQAAEIFLQKLENGELK